MKHGLPMANLIVRDTLRHKVTLLFTALFPLMFVFLYGFIFAERRADRILYSLAQLLVLMALSNSLFGFSNLWLDLRRKGVLRRLYTTPISHHAVLLGTALGWMVTASISFWVIVLSMEFLFPIDVLPRVGTLWALYLLGTAAFAGIALILATVVERPEGLAVAANTLFFPMMFLSGLVIPSFLLPTWAQRAGQLFPTYAMMEIFRSVLEKRDLGKMAFVYGLTIALVGIGGYGVAAAVYRWDPQQRWPRGHQVRILGALSLILIIPWLGTVVGTGTRWLSAWTQPRYILQVGHAFDGQGGLPYSPVYIGIQGDQIAFVAERVPDGWQRVRVVREPDAWVLPGLIDAHVHLGSPVIWDPSLREEDRWRHDLTAGYLASGVTTLRSVGDDYETLLDLRRVQRARLRPYPTILMAGPVFTAPGGHPLELPGFRYMPKDVRDRAVIQVDTPEAARSRLEELVREARPDWVKAVYGGGSEDGRTYPHMKREVLQALIQKAHEMGLRVTVHVDSVSDLREAVELGADMIEHVPTDALVDDATLEQMKRRGVAVCPTLAVLEGLSQQWSGRPPGVDEFTRRRLLPALRERLDETSSMDFLDFVPLAFRDVIVNWAEARFGQRLRHARDNVIRMVRAGIPLVAGSDAGNPHIFHGPGLLAELRAMVSAGLSPEAALRAATSEAARVLRLPSGHLMPDHTADIVLVGADPLKNIEHLRQIRAVIHWGRLHRVEDLIP